MDAKKLSKQIRSTVECANGNHYFIPYNTGNLICKKCGRFAKVGYLRKAAQNEETNK